jgi:DNA-binding CsgD family transcriptional regulator
MSSAPTSPGLAAISISRTPAQPVSADQVRLMETLMPHMRRAFHLFVTLGETARLQRGLMAALDALPAGTMIVAADATVLYANAVARQLLTTKAGVHLDGKRLRALRPLETARLRAAIATTGSPLRGTESSEPLLLLSHTDLRPLQVVVTPISGDRTSVPSGAHALVSINDPDAPREPDAAVLRVAYRLSPAELDVAWLLAAGHSLKDASERLGIATSTGRFHLKQLFAKTATHRQSELVRLLLTTMATRTAPR